jgi:hypothetical protein
MQTPQPDASISLVTDPMEIASIKRRGWSDIHGWPVQGEWYAYDGSLERPRARKRRAAKLLAEHASWWQRALSWVRGLFQREGAKP